MKFETPNKSLKKIWRGAKGVLMAGLLMGETDAKAIDTDKPITFGNKSGAVSELVSGSATKAETPESKTERQRFIDTTGYDMVAIAEKAGFTARLDVDNGAGSYIVHIGQMHSQEEIMELTQKQVERYEQIILSQKNVEQVLLDFSKQSNHPITNFFGEGVFENDSMQKAYTSWINIFNQIIPGEKCFSQVLIFYDLLAYSIYHLLIS